MTAAEQDLHGADYIAARLGKTAHWWKRNAHRYPHSRLGRSYVWSDEDIAEIRRLIQQRPGTTQPTDTGSFKPAPTRTRGKR